MIIQIFGKKNCNETKKVQRFFKERGIKTQFIDLLEKAPSKKEFENFLKYYDLIIGVLKRIGLSRSKSIVS